METVDLARKRRNFRGWTHEQELDLIELGERSARSLKGENGPRAERIVAGRAKRGLRFAQPFRIRNKRAWWEDW